MLVAIGDHRAAAVPAPIPDNVHFGGEKRVGVPHHGPDVEVVLPVLNRNVEGVSPQIEVGNDRAALPVPVPVDDVATIAVGKQLRIEAHVVGPRLGMGTHPNFLIVIAHRKSVYRSTMAPRLLVLLATLAVLAAACQAAAPADHAHSEDEPHEHLELEEAPPGEQAFQVKDGRSGWRRVPLIDVSATEFVDYGGGASGEPFSPVAAPGEILLLFFGYTSCPDVCPTTLADYRAAFDSMPRELVDRISFGMIGIDRERDADGEIDAYVSLFMENGHALLAPDEPALAAAAETFGVRYEIEDHESGAIDYLVGHTATVFAIDEDGHIIWEIGYPTPPDNITATLTDLLDERY